MDDQRAASYDLLSGVIGAALRLPIRAIGRYAATGARRNAWAAVQADLRRARDREEVHRFLRSRITPADHRAARGA